MKFKIVHELFKNNSNTKLDSVPALDKLVVAKNQRISFQVLLDPKVRSTINISQEMALSDEIDLKRYRVNVKTNHHVELFNQINLKDKEGIKHADILTHQSFITHDADMPGAVWVDVYLDEDNFNPEEYLTVQIFESIHMEDEIKVFEETITLEVLDVSIPTPKDYTIYTDLWQHNSNIARTYEVSLWSDEHFDLIENTLKTLQGLGQKSVMLIGSEVPWNGWGSHIMSKDGTILYEHSIIMCKKDMNGKIQTDFTHMQRYIDLCQKYGIDQDYSLYGLIGVWNLPLFPSFTPENHSESIMVRYFDERSDSYKFIKTQDELKTYITQIVEYFKNTQQFDKLRIAADEPKQDPKLQEKYDASIAFIQNIAPDIKFKLAIDKDDVIEKYQDITADVATSFPCTTRFYDKLSDSKRKLWYICNIPDKPNTFLHSPLYEARLLGVLNALFNYDGILRWAYTCWTKNPREDIHYATGGFPVGDLNIVYPEANGDVALSLRYKAMQRGIEDYEMMKAIGQKDVNQAVYKMLKLHTEPHDFMKASRITHDNLYTEDFQDYEKVHRYLIKEYGAHQQ